MARWSRVCIRHLAGRGNSEKYRRALDDESGKEVGHLMEIEYRKERVFRARRTHSAHSCTEWPRRSLRGTRCPSPTLQRFVSSYLFEAFSISTEVPTFSLRNVVL